MVAQEKKKIDHRGVGERVSTSLQCKVRTKKKTKKKQGSDGHQACILLPAYPPPTLAHRLKRRMVRFYVTATTTTTAKMVKAHKNNAAMCKTDNTHFAADQPVIRTFLSLFSNLTNASTRIERQRNHYCSCCFFLVTAGYGSMDASIPHYDKAIPDHE